MSKKKAPDQTAQSLNTRPQHTIPPRMKRLLLALLSRHEGITREEADRIAPASNGPHYVSQLRNRLDLEIPCERVNCTTRDGEASWYGLYYLTKQDRAKAREFLQ
ncbi:hypothetical protein SAMN05216217_11094 [Halopseudomonas yangmingensis]|uniref:Helix-turn-helix domain-containing protein n=1 Tax=Halopseudomonas yangmingensis TaxID=1720063 RepID=A0A1I4SLE5_9GAMM|nr:hypothetical protein SAMN05216217_11094 [Halopseudomonas yangmingensis]